MADTNRMTVTVTAKYLPMVLSTDSPHDFDESQVDPKPKN